MKALATIFLTATIFIQTFSTYIIKADFYLNRSYISQNLCINKDKPMMHCNGKCYLSKKISEEEKQNQAPVSKTEKFDVAPFFVPETFKIENTAFNIKPTFIIENESALSSFSHSIFHPPSE